MADAVLVLLQVVFNSTSVILNTLLNASSSSSGNATATATAVAVFSTFINLFNNGGQTDSQQELQTLLLNPWSLLTLKFNSLLFTQLPLFISTAEPLTLFLALCAAYIALRIVVAGLKYVWRWLRWLLKWTALTGFFLVGVWVYLAVTSAPGLMNMGNNGSSGGGGGSGGGRRSDLWRIAFIHSMNNHRETYIFVISKLDDIQ